VTCEPCRQLQEELREAITTCYHRADCLCAGGPFDVNICIRCDNTGCWTDLVDEHKYLCPVHAPASKEKK
jgi:hypothetical protein